MNDDSVIGSDECAALLRCTKEHAEELVRKGEIPGVKIGREWLFVRDDLLAFLAEKARAEALERRAQRQPGPQADPPKPRRRSPPSLAYRQQ